MSPPTPDHVQAALEASCAALITFESLRTLGANPTIDLRGVQEHTTQAIESLRLAIAQLRLAKGGEPGVLTMGFVVAGDPGSARRVRRKG
jgi:hypothetical protein